MTSLQEKQEQRLVSIERARKKAQGKANVFAEVFGNPQGVEVLLAIKEQFDQEILCMEGAHETIIRAAQRDVVRWIEEVITRGNSNVEG